MQFLNPPNLIAHRGLSHLAPENTLAAFEAAAKLKLKWLEFDVMLTKDHHPIIIHDETLNRTTSGKGYVSETLWKQVQKFDAGAWFHKQFREERVPSLEEVLYCMKENNLHAVLEIKPTPGTDVMTTEKIIETIERHWKEGLKKIIFASFSLASLIRVRSLLPKQAIGIAFHTWDQDCLELAKALECFSIHLNYKLLTPKRMKQLKQSNCQILAYTVNNASLARKLKEMGVDGFFSDSPELL